MRFAPWQRSPPPTGAPAVAVARTPGEPDLPRLPRRAGGRDTDAAVAGSVYARAPGGGERTGSGPADRRGKGTGHPLTARRPGCRRRPGRPGRAPATTPRSPPSPSAPRGRGKRGRPRAPPDEPHAGRGYDSGSTRRRLRWRGIEPRTGTRGTPHGSGPGRVRRVAERTASWAEGLRRVRSDRPGVVRGAPAASVIRSRILADDAAELGRFLSEPLGKFYIIYVIGRYVRGEKWYKL